MPSVHIVEDGKDYTIHYTSKGLSVTMMEDEKPGMALKLPLEAMKKPKHAMISDTKGVFLSESIQLTYSSQDPEFDGADIIRLDLVTDMNTPRILGVMTHVPEKVLISLFELGQVLSEVVEEDPEALVWGNTRANTENNPRTIVNQINRNEPQEGGYIRRRNVKKKAQTRKRRV